MISIQCLLAKGNVREMAWLPKKYAVEGKYLELQRDGSWTNGWRVIQVFAETAFDSAWVRERAEDHKDLKKRIK